jgi:hypothetical protein
LGRPLRVRSTLFGRQLLGAGTAALEAAASPKCHRDGIAFERRRFARRIRGVG